MVSNCHLTNVNFPIKRVYMGLEFQVQGDKVCYTPLKDKCDAIRNLE